MSGSSSTRLGLAIPCNWPRRGRELVGEKAFRARLSFIAVNPEGEIKQAITTTRHKSDHSIQGRKVEVR